MAWLKWNKRALNGGHKLSSVRVEFVLTREQLVRMVCRGLSEDMQFDDEGVEFICEENFKTVGRLDSFIKKSLENFGSSFGDYWSDDVPDHKAAEIVAVAERIVYWFYPNSGKPVGV